MTKFFLKGLNICVCIVIFLFNFRLQELSGSNEENPDLIDIELIQHINLDVTRLTKILSGKLILISIYTN